MLKSGAKVSNATTKYTQLQLNAPKATNHHNCKQAQPILKLAARATTSCSCSCSCCCCGVGGGGGCSHQSNSVASEKAKGYIELVDECCQPLLVVENHHWNTQQSGNIGHTNSNKNYNNINQESTTTFIPRPGATTGQLQASRDSAANHCQCYCCCCCTKLTTKTTTKSKQISPSRYKRYLGSMKPADFWDKYANIRWFGIVFFIVVSCFCIYQVIHMSEDDSSSKNKLLIQHQLKLVNVFGRHGDRSPSDGFPKGDPTAQKVSSFWPNGASNLTDSGKLRQFKIGLELQHRYASFLDFQPDHYLAFSSPIYRCQESLQHILRGLFENEWSLQEGLHFIQQLDSNCSPKRTNSSSPSPSITQLITTNKNATINGNNYTDCKWAMSQLPSGSGEPNDWQKIQVDTKTIPALTYDYLNNCSYRLAHPTSVDLDLFNSPSVAKLPGAHELARILKARYNQSFDYDAMVLWSTIAGEIRLIKTRETLAYGRHYFDWALMRLPELFGKDSNITLFDIYEQVSVLAYRERLDGKEINQIQLSPLLGSLLQSQLVALNRSEPPEFWFLKPNDLYHNKRLILYSSHDSIVQLLMYRLNMIRSYEDEGKSFKWRYEHCTSMSKKRAELDFNCYLTGLKMASYGMSVAFELWESRALREFEGGPKPVNDTKKAAAASGDAADKSGPTIVVSNGKQFVQVKSMPYVRALLYYDEDSRFHPVDYKLLPFGKMCSNWFTKTYPTESIDRFYDQDFKIDRQTSCPFELFRKLTSEYLIGPAKLQEWCGYY